MHVYIINSPTCETDKTILQRKKEKKKNPLLDPHELNACEIYITKNKIAWIYIKLQHIGWPQDF